MRAPSNCANSTASRCTRCPRRAARVGETGKSKRKLRKTSSISDRIELVQDFNFNTSSSRCKVTSDGQYLIVSGLHPPQVKCYDLSQLSMKWCRHLDAEIVDFTCLSDDYSKLAFICADRSIRFHAKFGSYYQTRTPKQGRDVCYSDWAGDLCGGELQRGLEVKFRARTVFTTVGESMR